MLARTALRALTAPRAWLPSACHVCGTWPASPLGQPICSACVQTFAAPTARCPTCALRLDVDSPCRIGNCRQAPAHLDRCATAVDYGYPWGQLIARFKFHGDTAWANTFADLMASAPEALALLDRCDLCAPLPLTAQRLGERGYNQAWLLVKALLRARPSHPACKADASLLLKLKDTTPQHELSREARLSNLNTAFAVPPAAMPFVARKRVLLVDDIMTTGATLAAAAHALKMAGAAEVNALVFARTPAD